MKSSTGKGMYLDGSPIVQPEDTYRFALNTVNVGDEGERGYVSNELGTTSKFTLPYNLIGHVNLNNEDVLLISADDEYADIGIQSNDTYTRLMHIYHQGLFSKQHQVKGEFRILNGCDRVVYLLTPNLLTINIDRLSLYFRDDLGLVTAEDANNYNDLSLAGVDGEGWDLDKLKMFPNYLYAHISNVEVLDSSGSLTSGTYHIVFSYLDASNNIIGWSEPSNTIPVINSSFSADFDQIVGASNLPTSKAIKIYIDNLDNSYSAYKLGIIASNGAIRTAYITESIPTSLNSYTLTDTSSLVEVTLNELTINPLIFEQAEDILQYKSRLLIAGVTEPTLDFAAFQQKANNAEVYWTATVKQNNSMSDALFGLSDSQVDANTTGYKNYTAYSHNRQYMRDEVYALGVVWVFKNGYISPVFHIPGRAKNIGHYDILPSNYEPNVHNRLAPTTGWDSTEYVVNSDVSINEVQFIPGLSTGDTLERWQIFNTATLEEINNPKIILTTPHFAGDLAYWESTTPYPDSVDCEGNRIYPEGNIRHHKMPDSTLLPPTLDGEDDGYDLVPYLNLHVTNLEPPSAYADQVQGCYIVRVKRDSTNSSVLDKGLFTNILDNNDPTSPTVPFTDGTSTVVPSCYFQPFPHNLTTRSNYTAELTETDRDPFLSGVHTPITKFLQTSLAPNYFKCERIFKSIAIIPEGTLTFQNNDPTDQYRATRLHTGYYTDPSFLPTFTNRTVEVSFYADADSYVTGMLDKPFNNVQQQEVYVIKTEASIPAVGSISEMSGAVNSQYVLYYYGSLKKYLPNQYGSLASLIYIKASDYIPYTGTPIDASFYGGDTFISELAFRRNFTLALRDPVWAVPIDNGYEVDATINPTVYATYLRGATTVEFYTESIVNCGMREEGSTPEEGLYPKSYDWLTFAALEVFLDSVSDVWELNLIPNYYSISQDFLQETDVKLYQGPNSNFDWCSNCLNKFKRRIHYSEKATEEDLFDTYRVFLANNYKDLPSNKGELKALFVETDKLYAHTEAGLWFIPNDEQSLENVDGGTIRLGTGSFLAFPVIEMKDVKTGYLGLDYKQTIQTTEYGTYFLSRNKVFKLSDGLEEVSRNGMSIFFEDNASVEFLNDFKDLTNLDYPYNNTSYGVGWIATYDREKKRYILTKRDFRILFADNYIGLKSAHLFNRSVGDVVWNSADSVFEVFEGFSPSLGIFVYTPLEFNDANYFENKSFTISLDTQTGFWISFHSYLPTYMYNTYYGFYSTDYSLNNTAQIWKHNTGLYQIIYGELKPHIIELVYRSNPLQSEISKSISLVSHARLFDANYRQWVDSMKTFDQVWLYNDNQSTGILNIINTNDATNTLASVSPYASLSYVDGEIFFYRADKTWKLKRFYNRYLNRSLPIGASNWASLSQNYFIDKIPNTLSHGTPSPFEQGKFRDKYVVVRYILNDPKAHKITTLVSSILSKPSIR